MFMESAALQEINNLLKDAPKEVLERTLGYIEEILTESNASSFSEPKVTYQLTELQKRELEAMDDLKEGDFFSAKELHKKVQEKYGF